MFPKIGGYRKRFDETNTYLFFIKDEQFLKNTIKFWTKSVIVLKNDLLVNHCVMKNSLKLH